MFAYRLAWQLGYLRVDEMLAAITPAEFCEWYAAYLVGLDDQDWDRAGTIAATIYNQGEAVRSTLTGKQLTQDRLRDPDFFIPGRSSELEPDVEAKIRAYVRH